MKKIINVCILFFSLGFNSFSFAESADFKVIDVRTVEEYTAGHLPDTLNIDFLKSDFKEQILKLDKNQTYKLFCRSGNRSGKALTLMKSLGFKNVENLGTIKEAAKALKRNCEGPSGCP